MLIGSFYGRGSWKLKPQICSGRASEGNHRCTCFSITSEQESRLAMEARADISRGALRCKRMYENTHKTIATRALRIYAVHICLLVLCRYRPASGEDRDRSGNGQQGNGFGCGWPSLSAPCASDVSCDCWFISAGSDVKPECARGLAKAGRVSAGATPLQAVAQLAPPLAT
jgi:hypothetical protein